MSFENTRSGKCNECKRIKMLVSVTGWNSKGDIIHGFCKHCLTELKIQNAKKPCVTCSAFHMDKSEYDDGQCKHCRMK